MLFFTSAYVPKLTLNDGEFTPLTPARIHDGAIGANQTIIVPVTGRGGVPAYDVRAVVANITVAGPTQAGFMTVFPAGMSLPSASTINFSKMAGAIANQITVNVGANGSISIFNVNGNARVIVDVSGYFSAPNGMSGSRFVPVDPARIHDATAGANSTTSVQVTGRGGVPGGATAVVANITAAGPTQAGFVTAYPADTGIPGASSLNFMAGTGAIANQITIKLSPDGRINLFNPHGNVRLIVDVSGYYTVEGNRFVGLNPVRINDSSYSPGQIKSIQITGVGGVPASHVKAVVVNVTAAGPTNAGFISAYPSGTPTPSTSSLNFTAGAGAIANQIVVKVGSNGRIDVFNPHGTTRVILDVSGYFVNNDALEDIPYDASKVMSSSANVSLQKIHQDLKYGPSAAQKFDVYETANQPSLAASNRDTLVWFFGGGWVGGDNKLSTGYDKIAKHLAAQYGFKLVAASYRLTSEAPYPAQYQDAVALVKHLKANAAALDIDPNRIILGGFSAGGDIASMAGHGYNAPEFQPGFVPANVAQQSALVHRILTFATPYSKVAWSTNYVATGSPIEGLNMLAGKPGTTINTNDYYKLEILPYASSDDPPEYTVMSPSDEVIPFTSQYPTLKVMGGRTSMILQRGGPNGHVSGLDANVPAILEFLR